MATLNRLSAAEVKNNPPGKYADGGGLWLHRRVDGGAQWILRVTIHGRRREMGLGAVPSTSLKDARVAAEKWRKLALQGVDPIKERVRLRREVAVEHPSLAEVAAETFEARKAQLKDEGRAGRWDSPLRVHILPKLGRVPIEDLDQRDIKNTLGPIWHSKPDAALKALNRLRIIFRHGAAMGLDVDLQAADKARALLGAQRHTPKNIPALDWREVPTFYASLDAGSVTHLAFRLLILTACRSSEIRLCQLEEIDGDTWVIPARRMKAGKEHRVPLSQEAQAIIREAEPFARGGFLFPGRGKGVMSDMTMTALLKRRGMKARPHGFRSSFRTWCAEATDTPREFAEASLAHSTAGKVESAYRRTDFLERRRVLMERWAGYCIGRGSSVIALEAKSVIR